MTKTVLAFSTGASDGQYLMCVACAVCVLRIIVICAAAFCFCATLGGVYTCWTKEMLCFEHKTRIVYQDETGGGVLKYELW